MGWRLNSGIDSNLRFEYVLPRESHPLIASSPVNSERALQQPANYGGFDFVEQLIEFLVLLIVEFKRTAQSGPLAPLILSGMILQHKETYYWVTAGHCIQDLQNALATGLSVEGSYLAPGERTESRILQLEEHRGLIAFSLAGKESEFVYEEHGADIGYIQIPAYYAEQIVSMGGRIAKSQNIPNPTHSFDTYFLCGNPVQWSAQDTSPINPGFVLTPMALQLSLIPEANPDTVPGRMVFDYSNSKVTCYGEELTSLVGLSGGPVFGVTRSNGKLQWTPVAVQSEADHERKKAFAYSLLPMRFALENAEPTA